MDMNYVGIYDAETRQQCAEMRLVLIAAGIVCEVSSTGRRWQLLVAESQVDEALEELSEYQQDKGDSTQVASFADVPQPAGTIEGVFGYAVIIVLCASLSWSEGLGEQVEEIGISHAGSVLDGQWWRTVTALTLHSDLGHLLSNCLFGAVFGFLAGQMLGGGVAWLLILFGGALGNFTNAMMRDEAHRSLGASTAVFAALGIAVAYALRPSLNVSQNAMQRWSPLIAGVLLLSFLGVGDERTDVGAHVMGFLSGLGCGWLASHLPSRWLCNSKIQWAAGLFAFAVVLVAWLVGWSFTSVGK